MHPNRLAEPRMLNAYRRCLPTDLQKALNHCKLLFLAMNYWLYIPFPLIGELLG